MDKAVETKRKEVGTAEISFTLLYFFGADGRLYFFDGSKTNPAAASTNQSAVDKTKRGRKVKCQIRS